MIIDIFLPLSLVFIMFSLGLGLTFTDFKNVAREPKAFLIGIINQMLILPIVAFLIANIFPLSNEMAVGLMILACCPGGVTSNIITKLANGDTALSISYTAVVSIVSVFTLPIMVGMSMQYFMGADAPSINILSLGLTMFFVTTVPVCIGLMVNSKFHQFAISFSQTANRISTLLFIIIVGGALASEWTAFIENLYVLGPSIVTLIVIMLFVGYNSAKLLHLNEPKAIAVSIESGIQNATVGITIGNIIMPMATGLSMLSLTSGVYGIMMYIVCLPCIYLFFGRR